MGKIFLMLNQMSSQARRFCLCNFNHS